MHPSDAILRGMAKSELSVAKVALLAAHFASQSNIAALQLLVYKYRQSLKTELFLRILLTYLPDTLDPTEYVSLLEALRYNTANLPSPSQGQVDVSVVDVSEDEAKHRVCKLRLLPLAWPNAPCDPQLDQFMLFLIHRSLKIDENTGIINYIPTLIAPFLQCSAYLRTWMISTILPLIRLNYEYYPNEIEPITIPQFEALDGRMAVSFILSKSGKNKELDFDPTVGRDLRGLVGPWMYSEEVCLEKKHKEGLIQSAPEEAISITEKHAQWEEVFKWIVGQAETSWKTTVNAIEGWDGPGDYDLGGYEKGNLLLNEDDQIYLERRYARAAIAAAYLIAEGSKNALEGVQRILQRIITLMDKDMIPTLEAACAMLIPFTGLHGSQICSRSSMKNLKSLLDDGNCLTTPNERSIKLLHTLLVSSMLCTRVGSLTTIKLSAELVFKQDEHHQRYHFQNLITAAGTNSKKEDRYWIRLRNELLWLRSWGAEEISEGANTTFGKGIFGRLSKDFIEIEILKLLLSNGRYNLAKSLYVVDSEPPLPYELLHDTVVLAALTEYDKATNPNKTRGGVKKCKDIVEVFADSFSESSVYEQLEHLITVTHAIGPYKLVLKEGKFFRPVRLRYHDDPISILAKILEQNSKSYTKLGDFVNMGKEIVKAGLTAEQNANGKRQIQSRRELEERLVDAERRVIGMCINAALADDDFETAYSYVTTRMKDKAAPAHAPTPDRIRGEDGLMAAPLPEILDQWSWRAALQAGKYRRISRTVKPTHLGNASGNPEIRHLEQRMDCLSHALRLAPKGTLQEILNFYRRCEEELESLVKQETEQEEAWGIGAAVQKMPGGFGGTFKKRDVDTSISRQPEESPMSLFDLSRASVARAQNGFSALSLLRGEATSAPLEDAYESDASGNTANLQMRVRKRDQLKNAAVGGLASGVGWLIGAHMPGEDARP